PAPSTQGIHARAALVHSENRALSLSRTNAYRAVRPNTNTIRITLRFSHVLLTPGVSHDQPTKIAPITAITIARRRESFASTPSANIPTVRDCARNARAAVTRILKSTNLRSME